MYNMYLCIIGNANFWPQNSEKHQCMIYIDFLEFVATKFKLNVFMID